MYIDLDSSDEYGNTMSNEQKIMASINNELVIQNMLQALSNQAIKETLDDDTIRDCYYAIATHISKTGKEACNASFKAKNELSGKII